MPEPEVQSFPAEVMRKVRDFLGPRKRLFYFFADNGSVVAVVLTLLLLFSMPVGWPVAVFRSVVAFWVLVPPLVIWLEYYVYFEPKDPDSASFKRDMKQHDYIKLFWAAFTGVVIAVCRGKL